LSFVTGHLSLVIIGRWSFSICHHFPFSIERAKTNGEINDKWKMTNGKSEPPNDTPREISTTGSVHFPLFDGASYQRLESFSALVAWHPTIGDVAELADAKVSKTFGITSRVGSIPTIPTTLELGAIDRHLALELGGFSSSSRHL
jgi:hypothetical protein